MDPEILWKSILKVMKNALKSEGIYNFILKVFSFMVESHLGTYNTIPFTFLDANLQFKNVKCCGISTQRATFINWRKSTGRPFHNFITWKDLRADQLVKEWNSSLTMKVRSRALSFPSLKLNLLQDIFIGIAFSRCLNGIFP